MQTIGNATRLMLVGAALTLLALHQALGQATSTEATDSASGAAAIAQTPAPGQTQSEAGRLSVNPVTGQTTALAPDYTPLTPAER